MLALTNPRMSGIGVKGLYISQELWMLIHSIAWNLLPICLSLELQSHPSPHRVAKCDSTVTIKAWLEFWFYHLLAIRLWSVVRHETMCNRTWQNVGLKEVFDKWLLLLILLFFYQHVSTGYASSLPALLKLAYPQDCFCWPNHFTPFPSFSLHLFHQSTGCQIVIHACLPDILIPTSLPDSTSFSNKFFCKAFYDHSSLKWP